MQITLSAIGKLRDPSLKALFDEYMKRLDWTLKLHELETKSASQQEGELLLKTIDSNSYVIILDEKGENIKSDGFADLMNTIQMHHNGKVTFVIGGADGLSEDIKSKANRTLAFGQMTWPHLFVRIMLMEQIYRAQQILKGHPYHRA